MVINLFRIFICLFMAASFNAHGVIIQQRIVALSPHSVELLFSLGVGDRIVGAMSHSDFPEAAKEIEVIGNHHGLQIERILELKPDLVVAWKGGNKQKDIDRLKQLGVNVYESDSREISQIAEEVLALGKLTGTESQAQTLIKHFHADLLRIKQANQTKSEVRFFYQLWSIPLRTISSSSWMNEILTLCQGENIIQDDNIGYPQVSLERVILAQPDVIIIPSAKAINNIEKMKEFGIDWLKWPEIPAVKNRQIYTINSDHAHRFSLRIVNAIEQVCNTFDQVRMAREQTFK